MKRSAPETTTRISSASPLKSNLQGNGDRSRLERWKRRREESQRGRGVSNVPQDHSERSYSSPQDLPIYRPHKIHIRDHTSDRLFIHFIISDGGSFHSGRESFFWGPWSRRSDARPSNVHYFLHPMGPAEEYSVTLRCTQDYTFKVSFGEVTSTLKRKQRERSGYDKRYFCFSIPLRIVLSFVFQWHAFNYIFFLIFHLKFFILLTIIIISIIITQILFQIILILIKFIRLKVFDMDQNYFKISLNYSNVSQT